MNLNAIVSFVYPFLSGRDQKLLSKVSKSLRECESKRHFYERISGFIQNHFHIVQCSLKVSRLPSLFFQDRVIYVLGEVHTVYLHRYLNGSLINLLFKERAAILGEGDQRSVQDQICFVDAAFRERVSGWDCQFPHLDVLVHEIVLFMQAVKNFHLRFPFGFEIDFFQLSDFINQYLPSFKGKIDEIEEIQNWDLFEWGSEEKIKALGAIYSKISKLFYCHLRDLYNGFIANLVACDEKRESRLISKIKEAESTVFVIAGADHASSSFVKKGVKGAPHLLLKPKDRLSWLDVFNDLNKRFPEKSFMLIDAAASKELPPIKKEGLSPEENIILLKTKFLRFNFDLMGSGPNHFGYWFRVLMTILEWDMKTSLTISHIVQLEARLQPDYYERLAYFVEDFFDIIYSSDDLHVVLQKKDLLIGLGENHLYESDRYLNGLLTHLIPAPGRRIYFEGGVPLNRESLKYINTSGVFFSDTWDTALPPSFFDIVKNIKIALSDIGDFFSEFPDDPRTTYEEIKEFVEDWISVRHRDSIMSIDAVQALKNKNLTERQRSRLIDEIYRRISQYYYNYCKGLDETCDEQLKLFNKKRNEGILRAALNVKGTVFVNAGHAHFENKEVLNGLKGSHKLIVKPKRNIQMGQLLNYLTIHFSPIGLPKFEGDLKAVANREELQTLIDAPKLSLDEIRDLKQKLIDFDIEDLDFGENHFDLWLQMALIVLKSSAT